MTEPFPQFQRFPVVYPPGSDFASKPARADGRPLAKPALSDDWDSDRHGVAHHAYDIIAGRGAPIVSVWDGEVPATVRITRPGEAPQTIPGAGRGEHAGNYVYVRHATGWTAYYAHLDQPASVGPGDAVKAGDVLGDVGNTGPESGPYHIHFVVKSPSWVSAPSFRELKALYDAGAWKWPPNARFPWLAVGAVGLAAMILGWVTLRSR